MLSSGGYPGLDLYALAAMDEGDEDYHVADYNHGDRASGCDYDDDDDDDDDDAGGGGGGGGGGGSPTYYQKDNNNKTTS